MIGTYLIYNSILLFASLFAYYAQQVDNKRQECFCRIMVFLVLWIPASLRYGIGTDYFSYYSIYRHIDWYSDELEAGYVWLNQLFHSLQLGHEWLFAAVAGITYAPLCFGLPKKGYAWWILFYVLTVYFESYSMMRQSIAISLSLYASVQLLQGHSKRYLVSIVLASLFHASALLLLFAFILKYMNFNRLNALLIAVVGVIFMFKFDFISKLFESEIFLNSMYGDYAFNSFNRETEMGSGLGVVVKCLVPCSCIFLSDKIQNAKRGNGFLVGMSIAYLLASSLAVQIHIFNRLVNAVSFISILGIGVISMIRLRYRKILLLFLLCLSALTFEYNIAVAQASKGGGVGISPYVSLFNR